MASFDENGKWIRPTNFGIGSRTRKHKLQEKHIRYAMENTSSNRQAASFLNVCYNTYKSYAKKYKDDESGQTLFDLHKNQSGQGVKKTLTTPTYKIPMIELLQGLHPDYELRSFRNRVLANKEGYFLIQCCKCGFDEKRLIDDVAPMMLHFIDGDTSNYIQTNWDLYCFNCYFMNVGTSIKYENFAVRASNVQNKQKSRKNKLEKKQQMLEMMKHNQVDPITAKLVLNLKDLPNENKGDE